MPQNTGYCDPAAQAPEVHGGSVLSFGKHRGRDWHVCLQKWCSADFGAREPLKEHTLIDMGIHYVSKFKVCIPSLKIRLYIKSMSRSECDLYPVYLHKFMV